MHSIYYLAKQPNAPTTMDSRQLLAHPDGKTVLYYGWGKGDLGKLFYYNDLMEHMPIKSTVTALDYKLDEDGDNTTEYTPGVKYPIQPIFGGITYAQNFSASLLETMEHFVLYYSTYLYNFRKKMAPESYYKEMMVHYILPPPFPMDHLKFAEIKTYEDFSEYVVDSMDRLAYAEAAQAMLLQAAYHSGAPIPYWCIALNTPIYLLERDWASHPAYGPYLKEPLCTEDDEGKMEMTANIDYEGLVTAVRNQHIKFVIQWPEMAVRFDSEWSCLEERYIIWRNTQVTFQYPYDSLPDKDAWGNPLYHFKVNMWMGYRPFPTEFFADYPKFDWISMPEHQFRSLCEHSENKGQDETDLEEQYEIDPHFHAVDPNTDEEDYMINQPDMQDSDMEDGTPIPTLTEESDSSEDSDSEKEEGEITDEEGEYSPTATPLLSTFYLSTMATEPTEPEHLSTPEATPAPTPISHLPPRDSSILMPPTMGPRNYDDPPSYEEAIKYLEDLNIGNWTTVVHPKEIDLSQDINNALIEFLYLRGVPIHPELESMEDLRHSWGLEAEPYSIQHTLMAFMEYMEDVVEIPYPNFTPELRRNSRLFPLQELTHFNYKGRHADTQKILYLDEIPHYQIFEEDSVDPGDIPHPMNINLDEPINPAIIKFLWLRGIPFRPERESFEMMRRSWGLGLEPYNPTLLKSAFMDYFFEYMEDKIDGYTEDFDLTMALNILEFPEDKFFDWTWNNETSPSDIEARKKQSDAAIKKFMEDRNINVKPNLDSYQMIRTAWGNDTAPANIAKVKEALQIYVSDPIHNLPSPKVIDFANQMEELPSTPKSDRFHRSDRYAETYSLNDHLTYLGINIDPNNRHYSALQAAWYNPNTDMKEEQQLWNEYMISWAITSYYKEGSLKQLPPHLPPHPYYFSDKEKKTLPRFTITQLLDHLAKMDTSVAPYTHDEEHMARMILGFCNLGLTEPQTVSDVSPQQSAPATPNMEMAAPTSDPFDILDQYPTFESQLGPYDPEGWIPVSPAFSEANSIDISLWGHLPVISLPVSRPDSPTDATYGSSSSDWSTTEASSALQLSDVTTTDDIFPLELCQVLDQAAQANSEDQYSSSYSMTTFYTNILDNGDGQVTFSDTMTGESFIIPIGLDPADLD
ncbi:hypothetical protein M408DRAFT_29420 [Serendipita vermifera MAFF 305830]|uniref:Uncharacterized protein n=1 Tax=Serendipita vermifera MAFF 305830 TaxID=933852 RepID=A0A0C2W5A4_SERVB|nr:hypothetical protein M408DRAFT_29420 [Serendipita vermifera MAFF 305830]